MRNRSLMFSICFSLVIASCFAQLQTNDTLQIVFLGGQSNMLCLRADPSLLPESDLDTSIAFYYHTGLRPGSHPTPFIATSDSTWTYLHTQIQIPFIAYEEEYFGPEMTLARTLAENGVENLGIFKVGYGGTTLAHDWKKGDTSASRLYEILMNELEIATDSLTSWGIPWKFIGMAWMQGESDAANFDMASAYESNLTEFTADIRSDFNTPEMPIVIGKIANTGHYPYSEQVRTAQANVANKDPLIKLIDLDDLPIGPDDVHYTTEGVISMGTRMGEALLLITTTIDKQERLRLLETHELVLANYPNPFNPATTVNYLLPVAADVSLKIYDLTGMLIRSFSSSHQEAGLHHVLWNGMDDSGNQIHTGVYFCRLKAGALRKTIKLVYLN